MSVWRSCRGAAVLAVVVALVTSAAVGAQQTRPASADSGQTADGAGTGSDTDALLAELRRLQTAIDALQTELADSRRQTAALEAVLQALREEMAEERELLNAKLGTLEQSKVESGSKYRVRLFGLALMQLVSARGSVDNIDLPLLALESVPGDSGGNLSAAVRQTFLGVAVFGPQLRGMDTSANVQVDFFGGFPDVNDGLSAPGVRLKTIAFAVDGRQTSIRAGQTAPFFSALSPTSIASTAYPALSSAGNIWAWVPQVYVERRISRPGATTLVLQAGVLDALTGELPAGEYSRLATAGERSRLPASAARIGWRRGEERVQAVGGGFYYSRQNWGYDRGVHAWAATGDFELTLTPKIGLSGELYHGQAIGGLGGGAHSSVLFAGPPDDPASKVRPLKSSGGWGQLKVKATPRLEVNTAMGIDRSRPEWTGALLLPPNDETPSASRNASAFVNVIYQPRSSLIFSAEYRRLWTRRFDGRSWLADHVSVSSGFVF
ncbi:MAG: hypothetical protein AB7Q29_17185 [Vicinamibacterales bacterium]